MPMEEDLDFTTESVEDVERGKDLPAGWHRAVVDQVADDYKHPGTLVFTFKIIGGPADGVKTQERLWNPENSTDTDSADALRRRRKIFAVRLGLVDRGASGQHARVDWEAAVGRECALKMVERKDKNGVMRVNVDWAGVYQLTDERVPAAIRGSVLPTRPTGQAGRAPATTAPPHRPPPAAVDYGSL